MSLEGDQAISLNGTDCSAYDVDIVSKNIWIYGSSIVIAFGTIGNVLSVLVMMRKTLQRHTTSVYLIVLAVVDTAVLYTGLMRYWFREIRGVDIRNISPGTCKIHIFFVYFLFQFEPCILIWVTLERLVAIFVPHRAKSMFTKRYAIIQVAISGFILAVLNSHFFWTHTLVSGCCITSADKYEYFVSKVWTWLDFVLSSFAPFALMLSINVAIITKLIFLQKIRSQQTTDTKKARISTMTSILLAVNFVFFLTTAPLNIYLIKENDFYENAESEEDIVRLDIVWACVNIVAYTNNAINFILYCLSGPTFRKELSKMLRTDRCVSYVHPVETSNVATFPTTVRDD